MEIDRHIEAVMGDGEREGEGRASVAAALRADHRDCVRAAGRVRCDGAAHALHLAQAKVARFYFAAYLALEV